MSFGCQLSCLTSANKVCSFVDEDLSWPRATTEPAQRKLTVSVFRGRSQAVGMGASLDPMQN